jgi:hypothetical protein
VRGVVDCLLVDDEKRRECRCRRLQRLLRNAKMVASVSSREICCPFREVIADPANWDGAKDITVPSRDSKKNGPRMDALLFTMVETERMFCRSKIFEGLSQNLVLSARRFSRS